MSGEFETSGTDEKSREDRLKEKFLAILSECASVIESCRQTPLNRATVYRWRHADPEFRKAWDEAVELGTDALEDEAIRRAHKGVRKPVYQQGRRVGTVREFSDTLLIFMLKARRPSKYKDRGHVELTGSNGAPIEIRASPSVDEFKQLPPEERIRLLRG